MKRSRDEEAFAYLNHVKAILGDENRDKFEEFLQLVGNARTNVEETKRRVKELLYRYRDLILGFNDFLPKEYQIVFDEERTKKNKTRDYRDEVVGFLNELKVLSCDNGGNRNLYEQFLVIMSCHHEKGLPIKDVNKGVGHLLQNHPDLYDKFIEFQSDSEQKIIEHVRPKRGGNEPRRSIEFLDRLQTATDDNPSYERNPNPPSEDNKSELVGQVINQVWIFKKDLKSISDKQQGSNLKEDDLYEANMLVDLVRSTKERMEQLVKNPSLDVVNHFKGSDLRCINHVYGDQGKNFLNLLKDKSTRATTLNLMLGRLEETTGKCTELLDQLKKA